MQHASHEPCLKKCLLAGFLRRILADRDVAALVGFAANREGHTSLPDHVIQHN